MAGGNMNSQMKNLGRSCNIC